MGVNVHTEWGPLKEIIVGNCINLERHNIDLSFKLFFNDNIKDQILKKSYTLQKRLVEQRQEDLDNYAKVLENLGIKVLRPKMLEKIKKFSTPNFEDYLCPVDNPRDQTLILGNEIIETSCIFRKRYFENDLLKHIFMDYFKKGAKWSCSPRPTMAVGSFDLSYVKETQKDSDKLDWSEYENIEENFEIMFDAANILKFGKDLIFNVSNKNHEMGVDWLKKHTQGKYNIHPVRVTDHHIDSMFMPLRPGVLLINESSMKDKLHLLPEKLQKWKILEQPKPHIAAADGDGYFLASSNISINVLPIDEKRVIVFDEGQEDMNPFMDLLDQNGFEPIKIQLRHCRIFSGGAHCVTLDTVRDDEFGEYL